MRPSVKRIAALGWLLFISAAGAQQLTERAVHYRYGDWTSWPVMRFATSAALGYDEVYFGTTRGILRYDVFQDRWDVPMTRSDGLEGGVVRVVAYDFGSGTLWCATERALNYWMETAEEWYFIPNENLGAGRVLSLGSGDDALWLETDNGLMKSFRNAWLFVPADRGESESDHVTWSGRLSAQRTQALPDLFMDDGALFFPQGYIQDFHLRRFDIRDQVTDKFNRLWMAV